MNVKEFVSIWKAEKESLLDLYMNSDDETAVAKMINALKLSEDGKQQMHKIVDNILTDTFYMFLMGLDGAANVGGTQQDYKIYDENNNLIFEPGDLEAEAYEQFQDS